MMQVYKMFIAGVFSLALCLSLAPLQASSSQGDEDKAQKLVAAYTRPILAKNLPNELLLLIKAYMEPGYGEWKHSPWLGSFFGIGNAIVASTPKDVERMTAEDIVKILSFLRKGEITCKEREAFFACFDKFLNNELSMHFGDNSQKARQVMIESVYHSSSLAGVPQDDKIGEVLVADAPFLSVLKGYKAFEAENYRPERIWGTRDELYVVWAKMYSSLTSREIRDWSAGDRLLAAYLIHVAYAGFLAERISYGIQGRKAIAGI